MKIDYTLIRQKLDDHSLDPESIETIDVVERRDVDQDKANELRCPTAVFGDNEATLLRLLSKGQVPNWLKEVPENDLRNSDLAVYYEDGSWRHVGLVMNDGRIYSKWGATDVLIHPVNLVPDRYGNEVKFYRPIE